uniref:very-long-chain 3-oxoacyl-CoA reductase-like n=1 Tax=Styela clava TaxID=7725 RepID=UPI0019398FEC|nr:very-long-chain 3-oxoacyl-CoA reductase-like [Styela clava]
MECNCVAYIGLASLTYLSLRLLWDIYSGVKLYFLSNYPDFRQYGEWSVITGATDGIGKATARVLAQRGQKIVLISRNLAKLQSTAKEIENDFNVETKIVRVDFTHDESIYEEISSEIKDLDIGVLVNNMGISYEHPEYFLQLPDLSATIMRMIRGNIMSVVKMTEIVLPGMADRKRGIILNITSAAALKPTPMLALYSASKDFVNHFSKSIAYEYEDQGIKIQSVMPFYVTTKLSKIRASSLLVPTPEVYAKSMLRGAGVTKFTHGYWAHGLEGWIVRLLPNWVYAYIMLQKGEAIRQKAYKKKEWQKKNNSGEVKKEQ